MRIELYSPSHKKAWDEFVLRSKNGTFLFQRDYMEYHRDRFEDHSLLLIEDDGKVAALLPAARLASALSSHAGLTYGGFVTSEAMKLPKMLQIFDETLAHLQKSGFSTFIYKTVPYPYHRLPAEEDRYALFLAGARLLRRGVLAVCDGRFPPAFQERRKRGAKKARQNGVAVKESEDFAAYWELLTLRLQQTHGSQPVHTIGEIETLRRSFPAHIRLFAAMEGETMVAGVVIHESDRVARAQYIAASERGQDLGALDLVFTELLSGTYQTKAYFDFGTSDAEDGRHVNQGLIDQKEGYGARVVAHDHYELAVKDWRPGQFVEALI
ncbi:MAG: GNAT family N-acetyltransferase [Verrucomicrobiota bacterium]|nr:GNAT family N-acetyltransferase [Verrucomicrobiota bacterium]